MMQQPSPALSSPSHGFSGPRASPLFWCVDQADGGGELAQSACSVESEAAPPKHLAQSLELLSQAIRQIADVRSGGEQFIESLDVAAWRRVKEAGRGGEEVIAGAEEVYKRLEKLRGIGRELEGWGLLADYQQQGAEGQTAVVCPDGAIGEYAWKRQIAGQAAASAVNRSRLALKSFKEQRRRLFPGLKACGSGRGSGGEKRSEEGVGDVVKRVNREAPTMKIRGYGRQEWARQALMRSGPDGDAGGVEKLPSSSSSSSSSTGCEVGDAAVLEVRIARVTRAIISLQPMGSIFPDAIAIFSVDEFGGHVHAWGVSEHKMYQRLSEYAVNALHYFTGQDRRSCLEQLLVWLYSYRSLFTKACSGCGRTLALDPPSELLLPPIVRPYKGSPESRQSRLDDTAGDGGVTAFHIGCAWRGR